MRGCGALGKTDKGAKPDPRNHESVGPAKRHVVGRPEPLSNPDAKRYGGPPPQRMNPSRQETIKMTSGDEATQMQRVRSNFKHIITKMASSNKGQGDYLWQIEELPLSDQKQGEL